MIPYYPLGVYRDKEGEANGYDFRSSSPVSVGRACCFPARSWPTRGCWRARAQLAAVLRPEMRGGTANCNVILSDTPVGSPIVQHPNVLMVMNNPSLDKYEDTVAPGAQDLRRFHAHRPQGPPHRRRGVLHPRHRSCRRDGRADARQHAAAPARWSKKTGCVRFDSIAPALHKVIPARKADLFDVNMKAVEAGKSVSGLTALQRSKGFPL